jgi:hypothetical protein
LDSGGKPAWAALAANMSRGPSCCQKMRRTMPLAMQAMKFATDWRSVMSGRAWRKAFSAASRAPVALGPPAAARAFWYSEKQSWTAGLWVGVGGGSALAFEGGVIGVAAEPELIWEVLEAETDCHMTDSFQDKKNARRGVQLRRALFSYLEQA